jgi:hypothetical protein
MRAVVADNGRGVAAGGCRLDREFSLRRLGEGIARIVGQPELIADYWPFEKPHKLPGLRGVEVPDLARVWSEGGVANGTAHRSSCMVLAIGTASDGDPDIKAWTRLYRSGKGVNRSCVS